MAGELGPLISEVSTALRQSQVASYTAASAVAWLAYDIVLTVPLEVKHIWKREWSLPKVLYIFARYYALFHVCFIFAIQVARDIPLPVSPISRQASVMLICTADLCSLYQDSWLVLGYIVDGLLILRLHSVYGRRRAVTIPLVVLYVVQAIIEAVVVGVSSDRANPIRPPPVLGSWVGCVYTYTSSPRFVLAAWIPALIFQSPSLFLLAPETTSNEIIMTGILFAMTLYKLWELRTNGIEAGGIMTVFVRDGAMFFAMIFAEELTNTLTTAIAPLPLLEVGGPWLIAVFGIVTSRLILNLREYSNTPDGLGSTTLRSGTMEQTGIELEFRRPPRSTQVSEIADNRESDP
ncbi:hypothetical protein AURDEDRAFT_169923 [Auricularia subglabra TFB-10046 SS5]|uniref:DUF6533 domain-containing protein n=1 Tax=Auricularia subglabra (strain TFB-10046 / SS5) TaxID=717982 RepID=J0LJY1_AURST|nr:hypothetical protein AURDEDRAFT_169923 [Auricularia subglabra TFB-10046 SS5]